jgi:hypothetical protein
VTQVHGNDDAGVAARDRHRPPWPATALLALGAWLLVSPLVLGTAQVTAGAVSAVAGGLAVAVLAGWALLAGNRIPPLAIACFFGLWLVLAPSLWEFGDGVDSAPGLVPIAPSDVTEPTQGLVARAEWNSILAGLLILLLAGTALLADRRRQARSAAGAGWKRRRPAEAPDGRR